MRKYLSVLALEVRSTVYKITGLLLAMAVLELCLLWHYLSADGAVSWDRISRALFLRQIFLIAFWLLCILLAWAGGSKRGSVQEFTLRRLAVDRRGIFLIWTGYHVFCLSLLVVWQILLVLWMDACLVAREPQLGQLSQRLFLEFYRVDFLHSLLPLEEGLRWACNGCLLLMTGMATAYAGFHPKGLRNKYLSVITMMLGILLGCFFRGIHSQELDLMTLFASLFLGILPMGIFVFGKGGKKSAWD